MEITFKAAAKKLLALTIKKKALEAAEKELKAILVGTPGVTYTFELGSVQVTSKTEDEATGVFTAKIVEKKFWALSKEMQAQLVALGVVVTEEIVIKGQAPVVKVPLAKAKGVSVNTHTKKSVKK